MLRLSALNSEIRDEPFADEAGVSSSHFTRLVRLSLLAPAITKAIIEGRHPPELTARRLMRDILFPLEWGEHRSALGFAKCERHRATIR